MTIPTSINMEGDQPRETGNEHFVNIFYVQILNLCEDFLSLWTLPYSKAALLIFTPPKVPSYGSWHPSSL